MGKDRRTFFQPRTVGHQAKGLVIQEQAVAVRGWRANKPSHDATLSSGPTVKAGVSSIFPLTLNALVGNPPPASRRELVQSSAMTLAMRTAPAALFKWWRRAVMDFTGGSRPPKEII